MLFQDFLFVNFFCKSLLILRRRRRSRSRSQTCVTGRVELVRIYTIPVHQTGNAALSMTVDVKLLQITAVAARDGQVSYWHTQKIYFRKIFQTLQSDWLSADVISDFSIDGHCDVMPKKFNRTPNRLNWIGSFVFLLFVCFIASNKNCLKIVFFWRWKSWNYQQFCFSYD